MAFLLVAVTSTAMGLDVMAATPRSTTVQTADSASRDARQILDGTRDSVIQVRGFFGENTAQAFHGSGFAAADGGVFITNYHVVAQRVQYPEQYRLEYRTPDGRTGGLSILSVDVRHDLAVVRAEDHAPAPLPLVTRVPSKGSRTYSVGYPLDVGLTITEGVSNGRVEDSFDPRIHYSGALNAGMSGGPALDARGDVIGVNVAGYRFRQLVGFLVPAEHAGALLARTPPEAPDDETLQRSVRDSLAAHSAALLGALQGPVPTQVISGYVLPDALAPFVDCSASANPDQETPVQTVNVQCDAKAGLFVERGRHSGSLTYSHHVLTARDIGAWRFAHQLTQVSGAIGSYGARKFVGPFACKSDIVELDALTASVLICVRSARKSDGLFDFTLRVTSLDQSSRGYASHLDMYGVDFDGGMDLIERFIRSMRWQS